ncbi:protein tramtrack, beta isoform isoform X2 [Anoplophora glabripennis]|uniref:protein tramtrack, beta isoform isoform X2 n=1 Tax=Anoplophora glabripennis TaxID=217634 RepID=UPI000874FA87|nr:protein tramtrack, beta isoform isoform X2 [Anoplophora glabripennis]
MASEQFSLCWDNFHKNMSSGMNSLLENEDLVDVTLAVEGKCLKAHKMVLSVCSPYFKELFKSNPCQHPIVFMKDVSYVALSDLLQFMYQGEVQVSQENLTTFIKTAEALQIKGLTGDGNGSADTDPIETPQEKPVHQIEEYKPMPRPKKQQPATVTTQSTPVKRPRLSVSSTDSQPLPPAVAKSEPVASVPSGGSSEPVQFKMEPYDQTQSLIDETGDENFGDDNLDDANVDDTEDYSMMEGGTGEEEPQAGTSTDGAGEGQELHKDEDELTLNVLIENSLTKHATNKRSRNVLYVDGFSYFTNKTSSNVRYLKCAKYKALQCRATAIIHSNESLRRNGVHNHPPDFTLQSRMKFRKALNETAQLMYDRSPSEIYQLVSEMYKDVAQLVPFEEVREQIRNYSRKGKKGHEMMY